MEPHVLDRGQFIDTASVQREVVGEGVTRTVLGHDPALMMTRVTFRQGAVGPIHRHPHRQVTYVESGSFEVLIGPDRRVLGAGECFFVPPSVDHGVVALEEGSLVDVFAPARMDFLRPGV